MPNPEPLNYAPPPPMHRRRSFRRRVYAIVLLGVIASGWWWIPPAWRRVELLYWQQKCMVYIPRSGQVVADSAHIAVSPHEWTQFYSILSPPGFKSDGTVFLHEMKTTNGDPRLVAVDISKNSNDFEIHTRVIFPGNVVRNPEEIICSWAGPAFVPFHHTFTIIAADIDPGDPSHFTFSYTVDGLKQVENGWLTNMDTVDLGIHSPLHKY